MVYMEAPRGAFDVIRTLVREEVKVGSGEDEQSRIGQGV